ncbi:MAG: multidrug effflux MFS transporter [Pseudomonadota bacterium]|nr:multidrug effflux MFS transporter [Pseudomonadota bacterium]
MTPETSQGGPPFRRLAVVLGLVAMMGPIASEMFLPVLPSLADDIGALIGDTEFALTALFAGMATGHLLYGPVSDRYGRKPVMLAAIAFFVVAALGVANSGNLPAILVWRFVQGMAASSGRILANAAARDLYTRERLGRLLSIIMMVSATVSFVTGFTGGILADHFPWQILFLIMAAYGTAIFLLVLFLFRETLPQKNVLAIRPLTAIRNYAYIARNPVFLAYAAGGAFLIAGLASYLNSSSGVLIGTYGLSPTFYGVLFAVLPLGFMAGSFVAARSVERTGMGTMILAGAVISLAAALVLLALALAGFRHWLAVIAPMAIFMFGFALVMPQISAGALTPFPNIAGSASSLQGFIMSVVSAGTSALLAFLADGTAVPMTAAITLSTTALLLVYVFAIRPLERGPGSGQHE